MGKTELRRTMRFARSSFEGTEITAPAQFRAILSPGLTVASYVPLRGEADPSSLARAAADIGCAMLLPHVSDRASPLRFLAWDIEAALVAGPFGLQQPPESAAEHSPDIILTPLLAFDFRLNRLGQGAGHYDRAFAAFPEARRIGVAYGFQEVADIDCDDWDIPLHGVVTENGWISR